MYISRELTIADYYNILDFFKTAPNKYAMVDMEGYGGKINTVDIGANAFIHRDVLMDFFCDTFFDDATHDREQNEIWLNSFFEFMGQYGNGHSYQNYPNRNQADFRWAYWGDYYSVLVDIKQKYDPNNLFRYQQSIGPEMKTKGNGQPVILFQNADIQYEIY